MATPVEGIVVELRPGGRFETLMLGEHGSHRTLATVTEVVPPALLAWIEPGSGMHTTSTLTDLGDDRTEVVIHQRHVPEAMLTPESRAGFLTSLDQLGPISRISRPETGRDRSPDLGGDHVHGAGRPPRRRGRRDLD